MSPGFAFPNTRFSRSSALLLRVRAADHRFLRGVFFLAKGRFAMATASGSLSAALEILHAALVLLCLCPGRKRAQIAPATGLRVDLARVEPVLAGLELADHDRLYAARSVKPRTPSCFAHWAQQNIWPLAS